MNNNSILHSPNKTYPSENDLSINVLHVDDEISFLEITKIYLERINRNLRITSVSSPQEVIQLLETEEFDLIISDFVMPRMNGLELLKKLQKQSINISFIILTCKGREEILIQALNSGVDYYLQKGPDLKSLFTELVHLMFRIVDRKRANESIHKLSSVVDQSPNSIIITDKNGKIEYVNTKFTQITGYTLEDTGGKTPRMLKSGKNSSETYEELWKTITTGGIWSGELQNKKKNSDLYWDFVIISSVKTPDGRITHFFSIQEEITDRKLND